MLWRMIQKEILANLVRPSFFVTSGLCAVLVLLSAYTGVQNYLTQKGEYDAALVLNRKNLESQPSYGALAGIGTKINKPPAVLGILVSGEESPLGRVAKVDVAFEPKLVDSKYESNPIFAVFGDLDLTFVTKTVLSLLAILWAYNMISGEKESGTLRLILSGAVPRHTLILGKAIGGFLCLFVVLLLFFLLSVLMVTLFSGVQLDGDAWVRLGAIYAVYILYVAVFLSLGLLVSSRTHESAASLLALLAIWTVLVLVIPKVSVILAGQMVEVPSAHEVQAQKDAFLMQIQREAEQEVRDYMKKMKDDKTPDKEKRDKFLAYVQELQARQLERQAQESGRLDREYENRQRSQAHLALALSRVSPASAMTFAATSLAQTGIDRHERFRTAVRAYKQEFITYVNSKLFSDIDKEKDKNTRIDLNGMPAFQFREESLSASVARVAPDVLVMALFVVLSFLIAYVSMLKYDVR